MPDKGWKQAERRWAKQLGTQRIPVTGERAGADFETPLLCVQAKLRRGMPSYLRDWLVGICGAARARGKVGLVLWKQPRQRDTEALVIMRYADFVALHGTLQEPDNDVRPALLRAFEDGE